MVFYSWMSFFMRIIFVDSHGAQGYSLVYFYMVSHYGRFSNHHPGTMVNAEMSAYPRPGMDIHACLAMGKFCYHTGDQSYTLTVEQMRNAIGGNGIETGIASNNFCFGFGCRVTRIHGGDILLQKIINLFQTIKKLLCQLFPIF